MDTNFHEPKITVDTYERSAKRQRDRLAFVEHICGVMIEDRFDLEEPPRPWRVFHGDVQSLFATVMCDELMPDAAFDFMPGKFVFSRFVSRRRTGAWDAPGRNASVNERVSSAFNDPCVAETRSLTVAFLPEHLGRGSPTDLFASLRETDRFSRKAAKTAKKTREDLWMR